mgnify:CR=1 FL=1
MKRQFITALTAVSIFFAAQTFGADYVDENITATIANSEVPVSALSYEQLKAIFTLQTQKWDDGTNIVVVMLPDDSVITKRFLSEHLGINVYRFRELVDAKIFSGKARPPRLVDSEREVFSTIIRSNGSIGFANGSIIIGDSKNGYKKIQIR